MSSFPRQKFEDFCKQLTIDSKESGLCKLWPLLGTQTRIVDELVKGFEDDIHWFVILKPRQVGATTLTQALDLFWPAQVPGLNGGLVTHDDAARDAFRSQFTTFMENLPKAWRPPVVQHNRNQMVYSNGSRLLYAVAGTKKKSGSLGKSKALVYLHATEVSAWGDPEGIASLKATLAEENPNRLYIWESTAQGFNHYYDMWREAKAARTQSAIFIGWWHNERYRVARDSDIFRVYWGVSGKPTAYERRSMREAAALYGAEISEEQWAWYRWQVKEKQGDELLMRQNYPTTEMEAFIESGTAFFSGAILTALMRRCREGREAGRRAETYRIEVKGEFKDTEVVLVNERFCTFRVWERMVPGGHYVLGADPAYGSSDWGDRFVASVWRAYGDRMVQVAEYVDHQIDTYAFAWIIAYLAGYYSSAGAPCSVILEINGPGQAVLNELNNLKRMRFLAGADPARKDLANVMRSINQFIYRRPDSFGGGGLLQWQSTYQTKNRAMHAFRDYVSRGMLVVNSVDLIEEMKGIVQEEGSAPEGTGRDKDDRVMAAALATVCWDGQVRSRLIQHGITWANSQKSAAEVQRPQTGAQKALAGYLKSAGIKVGGQ